jgi:Holliday junction resolvasome RuvABC endonuclease subunit
MKRTKKKNVQKTLELVPENKTASIKDDFIMMVHDPSFTAWGWAILNSNKDVIDHGVIKTQLADKKLRIRKGDDRVRRIVELNTELLRVIKKYKVNYMAAELPHGSQNAQAAIMMGACAGIIQTLSDTLKIGLEWYNEADAKKCALGKTSAAKIEMITKMMGEYSMRWYKVKYKDEALADALAIHYVACKQSSTLKLFMR